MKYRVSEILSQKTLPTSAGTEVIDVDVQDPISLLFFEYKNTLGSATLIEHVAQCLSKIELVDGSDVIFSLSGKEMHALDFFDTRRPGYSLISNISGDMQILGLGYNFGRKLWDPMLAFDPKKFRNPQLKISHSYRLSDASASAHTLRVLAMLFDEKQPSPMGFLSSKELYSYTPGASGSYEQIDLPTDYPIRKLMVRGYATDAYLYQVANQLRISEDNDKRVPLDIYMSTLQKLNHSLFPRYQEMAQFAVTNSNRDLWCTPTFDLNVAGAQISGTTPMIISKYPMNTPIKLQGAATTNGAYQVSGHQPHACEPVHFGDQDDPDDWYDVTKVGSLKMRVTAGASGSSGTVQVVTQQLRKY